jgi:regulator of protease activity HflC (stomatin/prohibitin superfamily)
LPSGSLFKIAQSDGKRTEIHALIKLTPTQIRPQVTAVEIKDIVLPDNMQRAMAKETEAERERRAKIVAAEGEASSWRSI